MSRRHQWTTFTSFAILFVTGALWLLFDRFVRLPGEFGEVPHPLQAWWLALHGAAATVFLLVLGSLVRGHMRIGWRTRQNRASGASIVVANVALIMTAWALYYVSGENWRATTAIIHWLTGLVAGPLLVVHVRAGRITQQRRQERSAHDQRTSGAAGRADIADLE